MPHRRGRKAKKTILEEYGEEREKVLEKLGGSKAAPFPRDAVAEALVLDARDRAAAKKRALVEAVPPPPIFDPFEDNLVRDRVFHCSHAIDATRFHLTMKWVVSFWILSQFIRVGAVAACQRGRGRGDDAPPHAGRAARAATPGTATTPETAAAGRRPEDLGLSGGCGRGSISPTRRGAASVTSSKQVALRRVSIRRARDTRASSRAQGLM